MYGSCDGCIVEDGTSDRDAIITKGIDADDGDPLMMVQLFNCSF